MAKPPGSASWLTIALAVAVAVTLVLGTTYVSLDLVGAPPPAIPSVLVFLALATTIAVLCAARYVGRILDELAAVRRLVEGVRTDMDERDGRLYVALSRRVMEPVTAEIPRPRVRAVATVPAIGLDSKVMDLGARISRRMAEGE